MQCSFKLKMSLEQWLSIKGKNAALFKKLQALSHLIKPVYQWSSSPVYWLIVLSALSFLSNQLSAPTIQCSCKCKYQYRERRFCTRLPLGNDRLLGLNVCMRRDFYYVGKVVIQSTLCELSPFAVDFFFFLQVSPVVYTKVCLILNV